MVYIKTYYTGEILLLFCLRINVFWRRHTYVFCFLFLFRYDYLKISNDKGQTFGFFCRNKTGKVVLVTGASVIVKFRSDFFLESKGFQLIFTSVSIGR